MSPQIHPNGFRISDRPVATSFAHPYSFQPVSDPIMRDEACLPSSMTLGGVEDQWVRYWDEGATIAKLEYEAEIPMQQPAPTKEKEKKKKKGPVSSRGIVHLHLTLIFQPRTLHLQLLPRPLRCLFLTSLLP